MADPRLTRGPGRRLPNRSAPLPIRSEASNAFCRRCEEPVYIFNSPCARGCDECRSAKLWCVSCKKPECRQLECGEHETCWSLHLNPNDTKRERERHKTSDPVPSLFVDAVTHSEKSEQRLQALHSADKFARWFSVKKDADADSNELLLYDRFTRLCDPGRSGNRGSEHVYPTFCSFIGNTSVGKSTIVRAMLLLGLLKRHGPDDELSPSAELGELIRQAKDGEMEMPVPKSGNIDHKTDPTTFGVHLYKDEGSSIKPGPVQRTSSIPNNTFGTGPLAQKPEYPLLLADCEGFGAGTATTNAEKLAEVSDEDDAGMMRFPIDAPCYGRDKDGVYLFYARTLYAISDVIVYVTKSDTTIKVDLTKVLEWASAAVDKSYNQPSRKTLIIVRNMERDDIKPEELREQYLNKFQEPLWKDSPILKNFVDRHNKLVRPESKIEENQHLYDALFQKICCCYIPDKDLSKEGSNQLQLVLDHFRSLRKLIETAATEEQKLRSKAHAQYNVPGTSHILTTIFDHFRTSEDPLDFYFATRRDNPTPVDTSQHVTNFLRLALEHEKGQSGNVEAMMTASVALMLLVYVRRNFTHLYGPATIFRKDLQNMWIDGVDVYLKTEERCSYRIFVKGGDPRGVRCGVRGRFNHTMHLHTPAPGSVGAAAKMLSFEGPFLEPRSWSPADKSATVRSIGDKFSELYNRVFTTHEGESDDERLAKLRQDTYKAHRALWGTIFSTKTCLYCLQAVPDHVLPCCHAFCPRCIQELAQPSRAFECAFDVTACPLCGTTFSPMHQVQLKPRCAGIRMLTLDGGGIKGIVLFALLEALRKEIGLSVHVGQLFDLVVGTSTGGLVGLALVMTDRSLGSMIAFFKDAAQQTFGKPRAGSMFSAVTGIVLGANTSLFSNNNLRAALDRYFEPRTILFAPSVSRQFQSATRVAVTTVKDRGVTECIIANYNRPLGNWDRFEREDDIQQDMTISQAGLATSAAPVYLPPFIKGNTDYVDGAVYANCPAGLAMSEKSKLWPYESTSLDILLSLGTGAQEKKGLKLPGMLNKIFFHPIVKRFEHQMNSTLLWQEMFEARTPVEQARMRRLNPPIASRKGKYVDLKDWEEMDHLQSQVATWAGRDINSSYIQHTANMLIASLFFFEPEGLPKDNEPLHGSVRCRLQHGSEALTALLKEKVVKFWHASSAKWDTPYDKLVWRSVKDIKSQSSRPSDMYAQDDDNMRKFRLNFHMAANNGGGSFQILAVQLKDVERHVPISGFPVTLADLSIRAQDPWSH